MWKQAFEAWPYTVSLLCQKIISKIQFVFIKAILFLFNPEETKQQLLSKNLRSVNFFSKECQKFQPTMQ